MSLSTDTIFALSSGRGPAAIAVIRISGSRAGAALTALGVKIPPPRKAGLARIRNSSSGEIIDEALVLWFPGPHSETGEDVAELQAHGGRAVIAAILDALGAIDGLRLAEGGEFTRRGFENGKLDLTAVEGLADLVGAETEAQRRQAFRQMTGLLGNRAEAWRQSLIKALALVEARIDFSDEADVPEDLVSPALGIARELRDEIATALADGRRGERLREGLVVAIAGPPNAGKSTLLNRIARREAAIVSPHAGTTRDVIEVHLDLGGLPVTLLDTAGIRETGDPVEMEGVRRARERAAGADLVLWVVDAAAPEEPPGGALADPVAGDGSAGGGLAGGGSHARAGSTQPVAGSVDGRQSWGAAGDRAAGQTGDRSGGDFAEEPPGGAMTDPVAGGGLAGAGSIARAGSTQPVAVSADSRQSGGAVGDPAAVHTGDRSGGDCPNAVVRGIGASSGPEMRAKHAPGQLGVKASVSAAASVSMSVSAPRPAPTSARVPTPGPPASTPAPAPSSGSAAASTSSALASAASVPAPASASARVPISAAVPAPAPTLAPEAAPIPAPAPASASVLASASASASALVPTPAFAHALASVAAPPLWIVRNKIDLLDQSVGKNESEFQINKKARNTVNNELSVNNNELSVKNERSLTYNERRFDLSATTGAGFDPLLTRLMEHAEATLAGAEQSLVSRVRHREALEQVLAALNRALGSDLAGHEDLLAEELRAAAAVLGRLTGRVDVEDVLDVIFRDFCIGK